VQVALDAAREICITRFATIAAGVSALGHVQEVVAVVFDDLAVGVFGNPDI
jgi:hypothetical protein